MKSITGMAALVCVVLSSAAFAAGNSTPGDDRYNNNPGRQQATDVGAQCGSGAGSGAFGYFGKDNNLGIKSDPTDPGANGQQTGLNNSALCGNRANAPGQLP
jgi:hypothetical protein